VLIVSHGARHQFWCKAVILRVFCHLCLEV
jgi:hypothetical protein